MHVYAGTMPAEVADEETTKGCLKKLIDVCQSMHYVFMPASDLSFPTSELNPCKLACTCKGWRMLSVCSHCIAITAMCMKGAYTSEYLEQLLAKLVEKPKRKSHRPKKTVGGTRIQPADSSDDDEPAAIDLDDVEEDLDDV